MSAVRKALCPVFVLASVFGVQMFQYHRLFLNYIQFALFWSIVAMCLAKLWILTEFRVVFMFLGNLIALGLVTTIPLIYKKKFENCLDSLAVINTSLREIDIPDEYDKLHASAWRSIGIWCLMVIYFVTTELQWMNAAFGKYWGPLIAILLNFHYIANFLSFIIICLVLRYTGTRFDRINNHFGALSGQTKKGSNRLPKLQFGVCDLLNPVVTKQQERDFWIIMHTHTDLCRISRELNRIFSVYITLEIATYFMFLLGLIVYTITGYLSYMRQKSSTQSMGLQLLIGLIAVIFKAFFFISRFLYINYTCESVSAKANSTRMLLHSFLNTVNCVQLRTEILEFILHMVNRPLKFCGAGMFCFGYTCIYSAAGAMSTMIVIILQSRTVTEEVLRVLYGVDEKSLEAKGNSSSSGISYSSPLECCNTTQKYLL